MGSLEAMERGSKDRYFQGNETDVKKLVPEGIAARVPYKGTLYEVVYQMLGGLRSGMGYCGAHNIEELHKAKFTRITNAVWPRAIPTMWLSLPRLPTTASRCNLWLVGCRLWAAMSLVGCRLRAAS